MYNKLLKMRTFGVIANYGENAKYPPTAISAMLTYCAINRIIQDGRHFCAAQEAKHSRLSCSRIFETGVLQTRPLK